MHVTSVPAGQLIIVALRPMWPGEDATELLLPRDPPECVAGLGYTTMLLVDAVRLLVIAECMRMLGGDDQDFRRLLNELYLTPEALASLATQMGAAIAPPAQLETRA